MSDYGKCVALKTDLLKVQCWNCTDGSTGDIPAGTEVEICHAHDATNTTICVKTGSSLVCVDAFYQPTPPACAMKSGLMGLPLNKHPDGRPPAQEHGFRFIVPNTMLREAGVDVPVTTRDIVGEIIAFESGEMNEDQARSLLTALKEDGTLPHLQGSYQRAARQLGVI